MKLISIFITISLASSAWAGQCTIYMESQDHLTELSWVEKDKMAKATSLQKCRLLSGSASFYGKRILQFSKDGKSMLLDRGSALNQSSTW